MATGTFYTCINVKCRFIFPYILCSFSPQSSYDFVVFTSTDLLKAHLNYTCENTARVLRATVRVFFGRSVGFPMNEKSCDLSSDNVWTNENDWLLHMRSSGPHLPLSMNRYIKRATSWETTVLRGDASHINVGSSKRWSDDGPGQQRRWSDFLIESRQEAILGPRGFGPWKKHSREDTLFL